MASTGLLLDGVLKAAARLFVCLLAKGVSRLPPDSDSISNKPRVFPSRWGVGPIAALKGDGAGCPSWYVLGLKSLRRVFGESYGSSSAG